MGQIITFDNAQRLIEGLLPLCEQENVFSDAMRGQGFSAFEPFQADYDSYAIGVDERSLGRQIQVENCKEFFLRKLISYAHRAKSSNVRFQSPILDCLRKKRGQFDRMSEQELLKEFNLEEIFVGKAIGPLESRRRKEKIENRLRYDQKEQAIRDASFKKVQQEARHYSTPVAFRYGNHERERVELFMEAASLDLMDRGFVGPNSKVKGSLYFCRSLNDDFYLRWSVVDAHRLAPWPEHDSRMSAFLVELDLCSAFHPPSELESDQQGTTMRLPYAQIVPFFLNAYTNFKANVELETLIKAHVCLLKLFITPFEKVFVQAFR